METSPPDKVGKGKMREATDPIETAHTGVVKIVPDMKKVEAIKAALRQMSGVSPFKKLIPYLESNT